MNSIKQMVKKELEQKGFDVCDSKKYTFMITKKNELNEISLYNIKVVINTNERPFWTLLNYDNVSRDDLVYIFVRKDNDKYVYHIVPSKNVSDYANKYHESFMRKNPKGNKISNTTRQFADTTSLHVPDKKENEYLNCWNYLN